MGAGASRHIPEPTRGMSRGRRCAAHPTSDDSVLCEATTTVPSIGM
jgi:hypothetical protein